MLQGPIECPPGGKRHVELMPPLPTLRIVIRVPGCGFGHEGGWGTALGSPTGEGFGATGFRLFPGERTAMSPVLQDCAALRSNMVLHNSEGLEGRGEGGGFLPSLPHQDSDSGRHGNNDTQGALAPSLFSLSLSLSLSG